MVKEFTYLGVIIAENRKEDQVIKVRIANRGQKYRMLRLLMKLKYVSRRTKDVTVIRVTAVYACEA